MAHVHLTQESLTFVVWSKNSLRLCLMSLSLVMKCTFKNVTPTGSQTFYSSCVVTLQFQKI